MILRTYGSRVLEGDMIPDPYEKTVHIPFQVRKGRIEALDSESFPALREGTVGHLVVAAYAFEEPEVRQRFTAKRRAFGLPAGCTLLFQIRPDGASPEDRRDYLVHQRNGDIRQMLGADFVVGTLKEPLEVELRGSKSARLRPAACYVPALNETATSVNHAYTRISERFERRRLSHAGNVFQKVYFEDTDELWKPLEVVRMRAEVAMLHTGAANESNL